MPPTAVSIAGGSDPHIPIPPGYRSTSSERHRNPRTVSLSGHRLSRSGRTRRACVWHHAFGDPFRSFPTLIIEQSPLTLRKYCCAPCVGCSYWSAVSAADPQKSDITAPLRLSQTSGPSTGNRVVPCSSLPTVTHLGQCSGSAPCRPEYSTWYVMIASMVRTNQEPLDLALGAACTFPTTASP